MCNKAGCGLPDMLHAGDEIGFNVEGRTAGAAFLIQGVDIVKCIHGAQKSPPQGKNLQNASRLSFHPNDNTATIVIRNEDFIKYLEATGNEYEFVELYE